MKQILIDTIPFQINRQMIAESERKNNGKVIVTGVLQRSGAKNQNGRIYPKEILMREANKYANEQIKERRLKLGGFIPERTTYSKPIKAPSKDIFDTVKIFLELLKTISQFL